MKEIIEINYEITRQRGLISDKTTIEDFVMKLEEEVQEFIDAAIHDKGDFDHELADVILVALNIARHYGVNIEKQLLSNCIYNSVRMASELKTKPEGEK